MPEVEIFTALVFAVVAVALVMRRLRRVPHAVGLVCGGIVVGVLPFAPDIRLDPDVIFLAFLPPILYPSAATYASEDLRGNLRPIGWLAIGLVLATMAAIGAAVHLVAGLPWAASFVLGAVLAPTDPVAATSVIRSSGAPGRLATILEGESLVNDGTALTVLKIALAAVGGGFAAGSAVGRFALIAGGGIAIGATLGWLVTWLRRRIDDVELESTIDVLLAFGAFLLAEQLGVSGVLATVSAGWVVGRADVSTPETRMRGSSFWRIAQFLAESMLFLLVGLAFGQVLDDPATRPAGELVGLSVLVVGVAVAVRLAWMFTVPYLAALSDPRTRGVRALVGAPERSVLGVAGLRGALSVAAALSIPATVDGTRFPERGTVIVVALGAIVALLVIPALSLPAVLRAVGLSGAGDDEERERQARLALAEAALQRADELAARDEVSEAIVARVRERYELRIERLADGDRAADASDRSAELRRLSRETLAAQRSRLQELRRQGKVSGELLRELERDLDLEEARIR